MRVLCTCYDIRVCILHALPCQPAGVGRLPHFEDVATQLGGLAAVLQPGHGQGRFLAEQVPFQGNQEQKGDQQVLAAGVEVGPQAVDLGNVASKVLVDLFMEVGSLEPCLQRREELGACTWSRIYRGAMACVQGAVAMYHRTYYTNKQLETHSTLFNAN